MYYPECIESTTLFHLLLSFQAHTLFDCCAAKSASDGLSYIANTQQ